MEVFESQEHFIVQRGDFSLWCSRRNGSLVAKKGPYGTLVRVRPHIRVKSFKSKCTRLFIEVCRCVHSMRRYFSQHLEYGCIHLKLTSQTTTKVYVCAGRHVIMFNNPLFQVKTYAMLGIQSVWDEYMVLLGKLDYIQVCSCWHSTSSPSYQFYCGELPTYLCLQKQYKQFCNCKIKRRYVFRNGTKASVDKTTTRSWCIAKAWENI